MSFLSVMHEESVHRVETNVPESKRSVIGHKTIPCRPSGRFSYPAVSFGSTSPCWYA